MTTPASPDPLPQAAAQLNVRDLFEDQVALRPDDVAIQTNEGCWTYAQLDQRVNRICHLLQTLGAAPGDRVAVLSENRREYAELLLAAAKTGVILTCMNWRQSPEELAHCVALVAPRVAVVSERHARHAAVFPGSTQVLCLGDAFEAAVAASDDRTPAHRAQPEDGLYILYTSGTTGKPKAAWISHRALLARGAVLTMDRILRRGSTFIAWPPMFHMISADIALITLMGGGKVIVSDGFDLDVLCNAVANERDLGWLVLMPGMLDKVIDEVRRRGIVPQPMDSIGCLPDLVPRHQIAEATRLFNAPFRNTFGSSETGPAPGGAGLIPVGVKPERLAKQQSSLCRIRLVDEAGQDVAMGEPGELLVRGPTLFSGYWGMPETSAEVFQDGWYHTGDVVRREAGGTFQFVDRRKYLIKSGGENIYPAEIEQLLLASPRIAEAAVVRKPDPRWGEVPVAFVAVRGDAMTADEVLALCRGHIANYKLPREVHFVDADDLPRSTSGKVMRHLLEERLG